MSQSITEAIPFLGVGKKRRQDEELVKYFQEQFESAKSNRAQIERNWILNYAMFMGKQNVVYTASQAISAGTGFRLFVPPQPPWRVRLVINKIRGIVRKEISKTTSQKPIFTVVPRTTEDEDIVAARAAEQIFMSAYTDKEIQTVLMQAAFWRSVCGVGYIKTWWDGQAIDKASNQMGDICIERIRPFNIIVPDLLEEDIEKQPWIIHAWTMPPEDAATRYGLSKLPAADATAATDMMEDAMLDLTGGRRGAAPKECIVMEVWIKRHPDFPNGGLVTIISDQLVQNYVDPMQFLPDGRTPNPNFQQPCYPFKHGEYPIAKMDHVPTGKYYGESVITDIVPVQRQLNRRRSQLIENANMTAKPRFLTQVGSIVTARITDEPGQMIQYQPGLAPPVPLEMPQMPQYVMQELEELQADLDDLSSQHEISRGNTPAQVTAATAISYLQEQDDSVLAPTIESQEKAIRKIGRQYLALVVQYWTTERTIKVVGDDGSFDAQTFMGSAIDGNNDVRVEAGSSLGQSKAAMRAIIMDLMNNGHIDAQAGLQRLEFGGVEKLYEDLQIDMRQAQRENMRMQQGMPIGVNSFDNNQIHVNIHDKFRKSEQFEVLPPEIQQLFADHVEMHNAALAALMPPDPLVNPDDPSSNGPTGQPVLKPPAGGS